jgi:hypothetical protein
MASAEVQVRIATLDQYLTPAAREAILVRAANLAIGRIKLRTGAGLAVDGTSFEPYSAGYASQRVRSGRKDKPVTLLLSGAMLGSMKVLQSDQTRAVIGFSGSSARVKFARRTRTVSVNQGVMGRTKVTVWATDKKSGATHTFKEQNVQIANALKAAWNDRGEGHNPRRHFFGLSMADRRLLVRDAIKQVIEAVRDASLQRMSSAGALRKARTGGA